MSVNPSNITLKGLFIDPTTGTTGGTRNIFNNNVMCAKIYLRFSYNASPDDTSTVRDVMIWLQDNGELRVEAGNNTDSGVPADFGWTSYGNTDPNNEAYVYDNLVVVPPSNENHDQLPGGSVWNMGFFLRADENAATSLNIYYRAYDVSLYDDLSTLSNAFMTVNCSTWNFSTNKFLLRQIWSGSKAVKDATTNAYIYALEYNSDTIPVTVQADFNAIYNISKNWLTQSSDPADKDYYWPLWDPAKGTKNGPVDAGSMVLRDAGPVITTWNSVFTLVASSYYYIPPTDANRVSIALLHSDGRQDFSGICSNSEYGTADFKGYQLQNDHITEEYPMSFDVTMDTDIIAFDGLIDTDFKADDANGPVIMLQEGTFAMIAGWGTLTSAGDFFQELEIFYGTASTPVTKQKCIDSFGQTFYITISWSNSNDQYELFGHPVRSFQPQYWSLNEIEKP